MGTFLTLTGAGAGASTAPPAGATYGYFSGGMTGAFGSSTETAVTDRITFSTSTTAAQTTADLSVARSRPAGLSDKSTYGYILGGSTAGDGIGALTAMTDRITFSTSTTAANTASDLSAAKYDMSGLSDGSTYGYVAGGRTNPSAVATADRITFSTGTTAANTASNLSMARYRAASVSDGSTYGYWVGGSTDGFNYFDTADRITFSTGATAARTTADLSTARYSPAGLSDGSTYGYVAGGRSSTEVTLTDRITFSTSATAANTTSNLSGAKRYHAANSDGSAYGYWGGGYSGGALSTADKITFSTGATAAQTTANLSTVRWGLTGYADGAI